MPSFARSWLRPSRDDWGLAVWPASDAPIGSCPVMSATRVPAKHPPRRVAGGRVLTQHPPLSSLAALAQSFDPPARCLPDHVLDCRRTLSLKQVRIPHDFFDRRG